MNILITTYFRGSQLEILLKSLHAQILEITNIYIVHQISDTEAIDVIEMFKKLPIIQVPINASGAVTALQAGIKSMESNGFLLLDDDVVLPKDYLERLRIIVNSKPDSVIAGTNLVIKQEFKDLNKIDETISSGTSNNAHPIGVKKIFGYVEGRFQEPFYGNLREIDHFQGCNVYIPNSLCLPPSKFIEDSVYYEMSWAFKLSQNMKLYVKPDLTVLHVQPHNQFRVSERENNSRDRVYSASRNMSLVMSDISNPIERFSTKLWFLAIGQKPIYGLVRSIISVFTGDASPKSAYKRFRESRRGWRNGKMLGTQYELGNN
jgi:hypothetical protein